MAGGRKKSAKVRVSRWAAMAAHASVESVAYLWTTKGFRVFMTAHALALCYYLGPSKSASLALKCALVCAAGKFATTVFTASSEDYKDDGKELSSIWDYDPPGDVANTGAWAVLRELAITLNSANEKFPELKSLETLPAPEMAVRLCFLFDHYDKHPVREDMPGEQGVDEQRLELLGRMLYFADQAYEGESERILNTRLAKHGYALAHVKLTSTWAEHCPAYYVALNMESKEMLIAVRGTAQIEDVVTDLTALPVEFGGSGHLVHSGVLSAANWLADRLACIAQGLSEAGFSVIVLGHSLGAGAAALLAVILKSRGIKQLQCYAFACPPCFDEELAGSCKDYVLSMALRDDVVCRFSPQALAKLNQELRDFDLETAKQQPNLRPGLQTVLKLAGAVEAVQNWQLPGMGGSDDANTGDSREDGDGKARAGEERRQSMKESEEQLQQYKPRIPGTVLYIYRREEDGFGRAMVSGGCESLQRIALSTCMINDHLAASYYEGLGQPNLTRQVLIEEGRAEPEEPDEDGEEDGAAGADKGSSRAAEEQAAKDEAEDSASPGRKAGAGEDEQAPDKQDGAEAGRKGAAGEQHQGE